MIDWKFVAEGLLRDYPLQKKAIESIPEKVHIIDDDMTALRGGGFDAIPTKGGTSHYEDRLISGVVSKDELINNARTALRRIRQVDKGLNALTAEERKILYCFYMGGGGYSRVMEDFHVEKTEAYRRRDRALKKFTIAMFGVTET